MGDWTAVQIDVIAVEAHRYEGSWRAIAALLRSKGYILTVRVAHDEFFARKAATNVVNILTKWSSDDCQRINRELGHTNVGRKGTTWRNVVSRCEFGETVRPSLFE